MLRPRLSSLAEYRVGAALWGTVAKFRGFLGTPRANTIPSIIQFPAVDIDGMSKRLKLKDRGREQGSQNMPATDALGLDPVEMVITGEIQAMAKEQYDAYLEQQKTYAERSADTGVRSLVLKIGATSQGAITDMERETKEKTGDLHARKREVIQTEEELNNFKSRHRLQRPPIHYGSKSGKIGALGLLLFVEAILNGVFLSKGSEFGLVGGVLDAAIIAGLNIAIGVSVGRFIAPWITHRNWIAKFISAIGVCAYLGAVLGFNLAVAHYRTSLAGDPFEASISAYHHLVAAPFAIEDLESWGMFVMGCLFSLFALGDGWWMDDPYPGYGRVMRHNLAALENYDELRADLYEDLDNIKKNAEDQMEDVTNTIGSRQGEFSNILLRSQALQAAMREHYEHLQSAANHVLSAYYNENQKHRKTPPPARFTDGSSWALPVPELSQVVISGAGQESYETALDEVFKEIPLHRDALHAAYREALDIYGSVDSLVKVTDQP